MKTMKFFSIIILIFPIFIIISAKQQMKILMVVSAFPKIHDICILNQITGLIDRGHDVHIFSFRRGDCEYVQKNVIEYDLLKKTIFGRLPRNLNDYDIIIFQLGHKLIDIRKTHNYKGKIVACLRGYDITGYLRENPHAYDKYFEVCDLFLPVCESFKRILQKAGCDERKIIVHHSSIDCSRFTFNPKKINKNKIVNIISSGRFIEKKGFVYVIYAVSYLLKKYPNMRYTIIGDGPLRNKYRKLIKRLGVRDIITIKGWYKHEEYIDILNNSHIFILSSVTAKNNDQEGIPNVLKEAMAIGIPVIATNHSGNQELIANKISGFLVPERNSQAISRAITFIIENPQLIEEVQKKAVDRVHKEFELEKCNNELETILLNLLNFKNQ